MAAIQAMTDMMLRTEGIVDHLKGQLHDSRADAAAGGNAIRSLEARALHAEGQAV